MLLHPIGIIQTPWQAPAAMPVQPPGAAASRGTIYLDRDLEEGLAGLAGFSHIFVIYGFHQTRETRLLVKPFLDDHSHGIFATRAPTRPNRLGLSVLRLCEVSGTTLKVTGVDMLDQSPLYDIKPYVPAFDQPAGDIRLGWLEGKADQAGAKRSDDRFV
jgi:tRNA-Thr(GGU) m(6)t(6)A37 methyltransferase TsaA